MRARDKLGHPSARGRDGVELLAALREERDPPLCGICEAPWVDGPLCRSCDVVLRQELRGYPAGRRS